MVACRASSLHRRQWAAAALGLLSVAALSRVARAQCQFARFVLDQPGETDALGQAVAAHDDLALITSWHEGDEPPLGVGEAYLLRITPERYEPVATFRAGGDEGPLGYAAAIDTDRLAVSFFFSHRKCWIYERVGDQWVYEAELRPPGDLVHDLFGENVALDGGTLVVTAPNENCVYVFERDDFHGWSGGTLLRPEDMTTVHDFGRSVALSGDIILVGAPGDQAHGLASGSAFIFERNDVGEWEERQKLMPIDLVALDTFGDAVAIEGDTAFVGSPGWAPDLVYVYQRGLDGVWRARQRLRSTSNSDIESFGTALAVRNDHLLVGDRIGGGYDLPGKGAGYLFERGPDDVWEALSRLASTDVDAYADLGACVALSDSFALLGAPRDTVDGVADAGSAVFFSLGEGGPDHDGDGYADVCECAGDVDGDGDVDADDLHDLLQTYGDTGRHVVDLDDDQDTDQADLAILLTYYGQVCE